MMRTLSNLLFFAAAFAPYSMAFSYELPWLNEHKIMGSNNLEPVSQANAEIYSWTRAIARLEIQVDDHASFKGVCTASRVGEDLFLTNAHCDSGIKQVTLGYEKGVKAQERLSLLITERLAVNRLLDYALFKAELSDETKELINSNYPILALSRAKLEEKHPVVLISHPQGRLKEIDQSQDCIITSTEPTSIIARQAIKHECDTEIGSSGAPLLDRATGHIIALHFGGLSATGNLAIPISLIIKDLENELDKDYFETLMIVD